MKLVGIYIAEAEGAPMLSREEVRAVAGRGLEGDRYFGQDKKQVTLIEREALEALARDYKLELPLHGSRRNLLTEGVPLNHLVGREFTVGTVRMRGLKLAEPCAYLEKLSGLPVMKGLVHRGGLRAEILTEGVLRIGDAIRT